MTEPAQNDPQEDFTPQENKGIETQASNPAVTNEFGERVDGGEGESLGAAEDSADGKDESK